MSVQYAATASQKFIWPRFTAVVPASTVAVSVTRLPAFTEVTATPLEVTASEVMDIPANAEELIAAVHTISAPLSNSNGRRAAALTDTNWSVENMLFDSHNCA